MDYYDFGLAQGLASNDSIVDYFTCNNTSKRDFNNVTLIKTFGDVWSAKGVRKGFYFLKGYINAFLISRKNRSDVFHLHFFNLGFLNLIVLLIAFFFKQKKVVTLHDVSSFHGISIRLVEKVSMFFIDGIIVHNIASKTALLKKKLSVPKLESYHTVITCLLFPCFLDQKIKRKLIYCFLAKLRK